MADDAEQLEVERRRAELAAEGFECRLVAPDELDDDTVGAMVALFKRSLGTWPRIPVEVSDADHLRWKVSAPGTEFCSGQIWRDRELVYATAVSKRTYRVGGERGTALKTSDLSVTPELQGQGLYTRSRPVMRDMLPPRDLSVVETGRSLGVKRLTERTDGIVYFGNPIRSWYRVLDARRFGREWMTNGERRLRLVLPVARAYGTLRAETPPVAGVAGVTIRTVDRFDERVDELDERASAGFYICGVRSAEYLNWRFADPRGGDYTIRVAEHGDRLLGYVVERHVGQRAYIVDLLVALDRPDVAVSLVAAAVDAATEEGCAGVGCWLAVRHPYRSALERNGFFDSHREPGIYCVPRDIGLEALRPVEDRDVVVHFLHGDTDML